MNTYNIAPTQTKMVMDPALLASFQALSSTLRWRPLTLNLESCEEGGFLYFRITLRLSGDGPTYAGFPSGAPFMLTRDCKVKKKGFFLRHWVRQEAQDHKTFSVSKLDHMQLAIVGETMLVRVHIDREMTLADTFKSVPFATWMFQVVQVDAAIEGASGVRFAFAIERTVTPEEREIIQSNVEHTKEQIKKQRAASKLAANRVGPIRAPPRPLPVQANRIVKPQTAQGRSSTAAKTPASLRRAQTTRQRQQPQSNARHMPTVASMTGIVARTLHPQNAVPLSAVPLAPHPPASVPVASGRSAPQATAKGNYANGRSHGGHANAAAASAYNATVEKRLNHPYLKLWEKRALDDPYEPFFLVDSDEMKSKMNTSWRVEDSSNASLQFNYKRLQSLPGANYPAYFHDVPDANHRPDADNDLLIMYPAKKIRTMVAEDKQSQDKESGKSNGVDAKMDLGSEPKQDVPEQQDNGGGKASDDSEQLAEKEQGKDKTTASTPQKGSVSESASLGKPDDDAKRANNVPKIAIEKKEGKDAGAEVAPRKASVNEDTQAMEVEMLKSVDQTAPSDIGNDLQHSADGMSVEKPGTEVEKDTEIKPKEDAEKVRECQTEKERKNGAEPENQVVKEDKNSIESEPGNQFDKEREVERLVGDIVKEFSVVKEPEKELKLPPDGLTVKLPENEPETVLDPMVQVASEKESVDPKQASHVECVDKEPDIDDANELEEVMETSESEVYSSYDYIAAVKAAADYNTNLAVDRAALQSWLLEDRRLGEDNDGTKDDDENESSSSD